MMNVQLFNLKFYFMSFGSVLAGIGGGILKGFGSVAGLIPGLNVAAPYITAGANALGNIASHQSNRMESFEDWQRQNNYNTPQSQMARYQAAGINPNLVAGHVGSGNGEAIRSTPDTGNYDVSSTLARNQSIMAASLDAEKTRAEINNIKSQTMANNIRSLNEQENQPLNNRILTAKATQEEVAKDIASSLQNHKVAQGMYETQHMFNLTLKDDEDLKHARLAYEQLAYKWEYGKDLSFGKMAADIIESRARAGFYSSESELAQARQMLVLNQSALTGLDIAWKNAGLDHNTPAGFKLAWAMAHGGLTEGAYNAAQKVQNNVDWSRANEYNLSGAERSWLSRPSLTGGEWESQFGEGYHFGVR